MWGVGGSVVFGGVYRYKVVVGNSGRCIHGVLV